MAGRRRRLEEKEMFALASRPVAEGGEPIGYMFRETEELLAKEGVEVEIFVPGCK